MNADLLGQLIDTHASALELYATQWTVSPADVVQESFMELIKLSKLPENVSAWLYKVVRNKALTASRSENRRRNHEAQASRLRNWFTTEGNRELDAEVAAEALNDLPDEQREIVIARIWGGLSFEQIAEVVESSSSTAHRRYETALNSLREKLGVTWPTNS